MSGSQQALLRKYGIKPVKRRGQNFLIDGNLARSIARETLGLGSRILELGAGGGALTVHLLDDAERVVCVEVDRNLCRLLEEEFGALDNFALVEADLGKLDWHETLRLAGSGAVIAGNLPYVLTSKVLFAAADLRQEISGGVFMVQKEVAERLVAPPGSRDYGILSVVLGSLFDISIVRAVPANVFWPRPEVASAVVRLAPGPEWAEDEYQKFKAMVRTVFGQRRKKLRTLLRSLLELDESTVEALARETGVDVDLRPEHIGHEDFRRLAAALPGDGPA